MLIVSVKEVHEPMYSYRIAGVNNVQVVLARELLPGKIDSKYTFPQKLLIIEYFYSPDYVGLLVFSKDEGSRECLPAKSAFERFLPSVIPHVVSNEIGIP